MPTRWLPWILLVLVLDTSQGLYLSMKSPTGGPELDLTCNENASLSRCTVEHNNRSSNIPSKDEFPKLSDGQCGVRLASLTSVTSGTFSCSSTNGTALSLVIESSNASSAMTAVIGTSATVPCGVGSVNRPISYCFFHVPALGLLDLSLGEFHAATATHAFGGRLRFGTCALVLHNINHNHSGRIRCLKQIRGAIYLHTIQLRVREPPLGGGVIAGITLSLVLLILLVVVIWLWRINRLPCQLAIINFPRRVRSYVQRRRAGKVSGIYDEIDLRPFRPKTPPRPHQFPTDVTDGYITPNPLTIKKPAAASDVTNLKPRTVSDLPCVRYDLMPGFKPLVPRDAVVRLDRPASYLDMRIDTVKEEPKYLSLIDITKEGEKCDPQPVQDPMYFNMVAGVSAIPSGKTVALSTDDSEYLKMTARACADPVEDYNYLKMSAAKSLSKVTEGDDPNYLQMSVVKSPSKVTEGDDPNYLQMSVVKSPSKVIEGGDPNCLKMTDAKRKPNVKPRKVEEDPMYGNICTGSSALEEEDDHPMFSD